MNVGGITSNYPMGYEAGNLAGYLDYKKFWDFLTQR